MKSKEKIIIVRRNKLNILKNIINNGNNIEQKSINDLPILKTKEKVNLPNVYSNLNNQTPNKKRIINGEILLNMNKRKINKIYISNNLITKTTDIKNSNEPDKINIVSTRRDFSSRNPTNKILEGLSKCSLNNLELSKLNSSRDEKSLLKNLQKQNTNFLKNLNNNNLLEIKKLRKNMII